MKLPNGDKTQLGDKLERYSLNLHHAKGKDKAILFNNQLGITLENKDQLEIAGSSGLTMQRLGKNASRSGSAAETAQNS